MHHGMDISKDQLLLWSTPHMFSNVSYFVNVTLTVNFNFCIKIKSFWFFCESLFNIIFDKMSLNSVVWWSWGFYKNWEMTKITRRLDISLVVTKYEICYFLYSVSYHPCYNASVILSFKESRLGYVREDYTSYFK